VASRVITNEADLREIIGTPAPLITAKISDRLNDLTRRFVEVSPFVCVATARGTRWPMR
jgi:predicted pyridoxine 5'-phosphate oxidase superfamily flavin-nucleotide-binding protein